MSQSALQARNYVITAAGVWAPVGFDANSHPLPVRDEPTTTATLSSQTTAANTSAQVFAANPNRLFASIYNENTTAATICYLHLGAGPASTTAYSLRLGISAYFEIPRGYCGPVFVISNGVLTLRKTEVV